MSLDAFVHGIFARPGAIKALVDAHRKIGAARKVVFEYWDNCPAGTVGLLTDGPNAWAMHVALVQLAEVLKR